MDFQYLTLRLRAQCQESPGSRRKLLIQKTANKKLKKELKGNKNRTKTTNHIFRKRK
jgi:hypothetical protein